MICWWKAGLKLRCFSIWFRLWARFIWLIWWRAKMWFRIGIYRRFIIICIFNTTVGFSLLVWVWHLGFWIVFAGFTLNWSTSQFLRFLYFLFLVVNFLTYVLCFVSDFFYAQITQRWRIGRKNWCSRPIVRLED